jgi:hypothetical protein
MRSNSIVSNNLGHFDTIHRPYGIPTDLIRKDYIVLYFEFQYFVLWGIEYIKSIYPDNNIFILFIINDDMSTKETIFLAKSDKVEEKARYNPIVKDGARSYRFIKYIPRDLFDEKPIKITLSVGLYCTGSLMPLSQEEYFVQPDKANEFSRFHIYQNTYIKHTGKKMGNVFFNFIYKHDTIYLDDIETANAGYFGEFAKIDKSITFKENPQLQLLYYNISNSTFYFKKSDIISFTSIHQIKELELSGELKGDNVTLNRLLELLDFACKKYDLFTILKMLYAFICKKEFTIDRLQIFKEKLSRLFESIIDIPDLHDRVIIPFIFDIFRTVFFKSSKPDKKKKKYTEKVDELRYQEVSMSI